MNPALPKPLISVDQLTDLLDHPDLLLIDASVANVVGKSEAIQYPEITTLPNAVHLDLDGPFADKTTQLPHMLPSIEQFAKAAQNLGVSDNSLIVIFDNQGIYSAPRAWWMFRAFGIDNVTVLSGGVPAWQAAGHKTTNIYRPPRTASIPPTLVPRTKAAMDHQALLTNIDTETFVVLDARSPGRFQGFAPEPRKGVPSGHIPGSVNLHFETLEEGFGLKPKPVLREIFTDLGLDEDTQVVTSCGSGMTAAILCLAAAEAGFPDWGLYDGSWLDWTARQHPIDRGAN